MSEIKDLIRHALDQDYNKANDTFGEIMSIKMTDLINQEEIKVANSIYNGVEDTDDEEEGIEIDDADWMILKISRTTKSKKMMIPSAMMRMMRTMMRTKRVNC